MKTDISRRVGSRGWAVGAGAVLGVALAFASLGAASAQAPIAQAPIRASSQVWHVDNSPCEGPFAYWPF